MKQPRTRLLLRGLNLFAAAFFLSLILSTSTVAFGDETRVWVDSTGKYKIEATLVSHTDSTVKLRRGDGRIIEMPIKKLSAEDRAFLESYNDNPFETGLVSESESDESPDDGAAGSSKGLQISGRRATLKGFPEKIYVGDSDSARNLPDVGANIKWSYYPQAIKEPEKGDSYTFPIGKNSVLGDRLSVSELRLVVNPLDPKAPIYVGLTSTLQNKDSFIVRCDREKGVVDASVLPVQEAVLHDVSPDGAYALAIAKLPVESLSKKSFIAIAPLAGLGAQRELSDTVIFGPYYSDELAANILKATKIEEITDAYWVDSSNILTRSAGGVVSLWDLRNCRAEYSQKVGDASVILDPARKAYVAASESVVSVFNIADGAALGRVSLTDANESAPISFVRYAAAFSPSGRKLAVVGSNKAVVVDMEKGEKLTSIPVSGLSADVAWGTDDYLIVNSVGYDLKTGFPVCRYNGLLSCHGSMVYSNGQVWSLVLDHTLVSFEAPHAAARSVMQNMKADDAFELYPGLALSIKCELNNLHDQKEVENYLKDSIAKAGFKYDPKSKITVVAKSVDTGKTEEITVASVETSSPFGIGRPFPRAGLLGSERLKEAKTMSLKIFRQSIEIEKDKKTIWGFSEETMGPEHLERDPDKTMEQQVEESNKPEIKFFRFAPIPRYVAKSGRAGVDAAISANVTSSGLK